MIQTKPSGASKRRPRLDDPNLWATIHNRTISPAEGAEMARTITALYEALYRARRNQNGAKAS